MLAFDCGMRAVLAMMEPAQGVQRLLCRNIGGQTTRNGPGALSLEDDYILYRLTKEATEGRGFLDASNFPTSHVTTFLQAAGSTEMLARAVS
jgi:hypothetical protein